MSEKDQAFIELVASVNLDAAGKDFDALSTKLTAALTKATSGFAKKLGESIKIEFDATIIGTLTKPITLTLDTKAAKSQVDALVKPLQTVIGQLEAAQKAISSGVSPTTGKAPTKTEQNAQAKKLETLTSQEKTKTEVVTSIRETNSSLNSAKSLSTETRDKLIADIDKLTLRFKEINNLKLDTTSLLGKESVKELENILKDLGKVKSSIVDIERVSEGRSKILGGASKELDGLLFSLGRAQEAIKDVDLGNIEVELADGTKALKKLSVTEEQLGIISADALSAIKSLTKEMGFLADTDPENIEQVDKHLKNISNYKFKAESFINTVELNRFDKTFLSGAQQKAQAEVIKNQQELNLEFKKTNDQQQKLNNAQSALGNSEDEINAYKDSIQQTSEALKKFGLNEDFSEELTKKLNTSVSNLRDQYARLREELGKSQTDLKKVDSLVNSIGKNQTDFKAFSNTLANNAGGILTDRLNTQKALPPSKSLAISQIIPQGIASSTKLIGDYEAKLNQLRTTVADSGVPLIDVVKKTSSFEAALTGARVALTRLNEQLEAGQLTEKEANTRFNQINETLARTKIAIEQVKPEKLLKDFNADQLDRFQKGLSTNLAVLGFTLQRIGGELNNFGQTALGVFGQLATAADPIEKARNILQTTFGPESTATLKLSNEEQERLVNNLKNLGDLPGNNLKDTTEQFLRFADALGDADKAFVITKGLIGLATKSGVDKSNQLTQILLDARTKDKGFNQDSFGKLKSLGGSNVERILETAGINSTDDANKAGTSKIIRILGEELSKLSPPLLSTADRFNKLNNRVAELGEIVGKVLSPALDELNNLLNDRILPILKDLQNRFNALSPSTQDWISRLVLGIPVVALIGGSLISLAGILAFVGSGFLQLQGLTSLFFSSVSKKLGKLGITVAAEEAAIAAEKATSSIAKLSQSGINPNLLARFSTKKGVASTGTSVVDTVAIVRETPDAIKLTSQLSTKLKELSDAKSLLSSARKNTFGVFDPDDVSRAAKQVANLENSVTRLKSLLGSKSFVASGINSFETFTTSVKNFGSNILEIPNKLKTGFGSIGGIFKQLGSVISGGVGGIAKSGAEFISFIREFGVFKSLLGGTVGAISGVTKGIGSIGGGLLKILGFTNPIGIAINVIISLATALISNFNGVRDRLTLTFRDVNTAINRVLKSLGLDEGGLLKVLSLIGDAFNAVFGFIGEVMLDVVIALGGAIADMANNLANIIGYFKNGEIGNGLLEIVKLIGNGLTSVLRRLVFELVATLGDAVGGLLEASIGKGRISDSFRGAADYIRSLNGTDKASVDEKLREESRESYRKQREESKRADQKKTTDEALEAEKEKADRIKKTESALKDLNSKSREDYLKLIAEQKADAIKIRIADIKSLSDEQLTLSKDLISNARSEAELTLRYNDALKNVKTTTDAITASSSKLNFTSALGEFAKLTSKTENGFREIFALADDGQQPFVNLANAIKAAGNATTLEGLQAGLNKLREFDDPNVKNAIEKVGAVISQNAIGTQNYIREYRKTLTDLRKLEEERRFAIVQDIERLQVEREIRKMSNAEEVAQLKSKLRDAQVEARGGSETEKAINARLDEIRTTSSSFARERLQLIFELKQSKEKDIQDEKLRGEQQRDVMSRSPGIPLVSSNLQQTPEEFQKANSNPPKFSKQDYIAGKPLVVDNVTSQYLANTNAATDATNNLADSSVNVTDRIDTQSSKTQELTDKLSDLDKKIIDTTNELTNLYNQKQTTAARTFAGSILESFATLNTVFNTGIQSFSKAIGKFLFGQSGGETTDKNFLVNQLKRLIDVSKELPESSRYTQEYSNVLKNLEDGSINASEAIEKLINIRATALSQDAIFAAGNIEQEALNNINSLKIQYGELKEDFQSILFSSSKDLVGDFVKEIVKGFGSPDAELLKNGVTGFKQLNGKFLSSVNIIEDVRKIGNDNIATAGFQEALENISTRDENNAEIPFSSTLKEIIDLADKFQGTDKEVSKQILAYILGLNIEQIPSQVLAGLRTEIYNKLIKLQDARRAKDKAIVDNTILSQIETVDSTLQSASNQINEKIVSAESSLEKLDNQLKDAQGKERDTILKQQAELRVQLINFNFKRLDDEETYNIQKATLQANGNQVEIDTIVKQGQVRRDKLREQYNLQLRDLAESGGARLDADGKPVDANGLPIAPPTVAKAVNLGGTDKSKSITDSTGKEITGKPASRTTEILNTLNSYKGALGAVGSAAQEAGSQVLGFFDRLASGANVIADFEAMLGGMGFSLDNLKATFQDLAITGIAAFGDSLGKAIADVLVNGGNFLKNLGKFFGDSLIALGTQLLQIGIAAAALATIGTLFPVLRPLTGGSEGFAGAAVAVATGVGLILAGKALGGGGGSTASASNENATNSANTSSGNTGQITYDPLKDPKLIYQKGLQTQVLIEVRTDDVNLVKKFVKTVNRDERLGNLVGNNRTGFAL